MLAPFPISSRKWNSGARRNPPAKPAIAARSCGLNAWAKPDVSLICGECDEKLEAEPEEEGG
jgi:hypothetical protein